MMKIDIVSAVLTILNELIDGAASLDTWILNPGDPGVLRSLEKISAADASQVPSGSGASVATHVHHLQYGLHLLNRWSRGEEPFADADYAASWKRTIVTEVEWTALLDALRQEAFRWREAVARPREMSTNELTTVVASIAHLAYHLGAIRQINRSTRGPSACD